MTNRMDFEVEMPAGEGLMYLHSSEEVAIWERLLKSYRDEHQITMASDLVIVGTLLTQQIRLYRGQQLSMGRQVRFDEEHKPTGEYEFVGAEESRRGDSMVDQASKEISRIEDALGISKKAREAGGANTIAEYISNGKRFAHEYGIHIVERVIYLEGFAMKLKTMIRMLDNLDEEDRAYHGISPENILEFCRRATAYMEEKDMEWAKDKGILFRGSMD